jgi:DNA-binding beta-propeller fold protein YncE
VGFRLLTLVIGLATAGPPSVPTITAPRQSADGIVTFRFASHARGVSAGRLRYRCGIDAAPLARCRSPYVVRLSPGRHTFRVQAVDPRGRRSGFARASVEVLRPPLSVKVGLSPVAMTFGSNALWTADYDGGTVTRVEGGKSRARIAIGGSPGGIAFAGGSIWVGDFRPNGLLTRLDPATNRVIGHLVLGGQPAGLLGDGDTLWVADYSGSVVRVDARTNTAVARIPVGGNPESCALGFGLLWVSNQDGTLTAIDPSRNAVAGAKVTGDPDLDAVAVGTNALWTTSFYGGTLLKVDPASRRVVQRIRLGGEGSGVLVRDGSVWASVYDAGLVVRVDAASGRIVQRIRVGEKPRDLVFDGTSIWVVNQGSSTITRLSP